MKVSIIMLAYSSIVNCQDYFLSEKYGEDMVATVRENQQSRSDFLIWIFPPNPLSVARGPWARGP